MFEFPCEGEKSTMKNLSSLNQFKTIDAKQQANISGGWLQYLIPVVVSGLNHTDQIMRGWKKGYHRHH